MCGMKINLPLEKLERKSWKKIRDSEKKTSDLLLLYWFLLRPPFTVDDVGGTARVLSQLITTIVLSVSFRRSRQKAATAYVYEAPEGTKS